MEEKPIMIDPNNSVLMVCCCKNKCNPNYLTLKDLDGLNVMLHYIDDNGDIAPVPLEKLNGE